MAIAQQDGIMIRPDRASGERNAKPVGRAFARHAARTRMDMKAIVCTDQILGKACYLRDLSSSGARLEYTAGKMPDVSKFVLYIPSCRISLNCRLVWQSGRTVGIEFDRGRPGYPDLMESLLPLAA